MDYQAICRATREIAYEAGNYIFGRIKSISMNEVEVKGMHNFVTEVDKTAEAMIMLMWVMPTRRFCAVV